MLADEKMNRSTQPNAKATVLWTIWFSLVCAIVFYQFKLGGGWLRGEDARSALQNPASWISFGSLLGAAITRWLFIPKTREMRRLLILMIVGMALSEGIAFYGIFLFPADMPQTKMGLFFLSLVSALQFVPVYAKDIVPENNG